MATKRRLADREKQASIVTEEAVTTEVDGFDGKNIEDLYLGSDGDDTDSSESYHSSLEEIEGEGSDEVEEQEGESDGDSEDKGEEENAGSSKSTGPGSSKSTGAGSSKSTGPGSSKSTGPGSSKSTGAGSSKSTGPGSSKSTGAGSSKSPGSGSSKPFSARNDDDDVNTSDEEDARNTVGNIPMEWYNDYPHIGYDLSGQQIMKPATGDELDKFLAKMDDPDYWRTIQDKYTGRDIVLTDEEVDMIQKMQASQYVGLGNPYEPYVDYFTGDPMIHPLTNKPPIKRNFIPSKWENQKIQKIVVAIRRGLIKMNTGPRKPTVHMLWNDTDKPAQRKHRMHIPAPKMKLPGHEESYNPPPEYLPTEEEIQKWKSSAVEDRKTKFLTKKYNSLREVPAYSNFMRERFERCLDLYLCPRKLKMKVNIDDPDQLLPNLPKPKDLQPFPTKESIIYRGHTGMVRCIAIEAEGQWLASGSDDGSVRLWEVDSGRCVKSLAVNGTPHSLSFCPNRELSLLAVAVETNLYIVNHEMADRLVSMATDSVLSRALGGAESQDSTDPKPSVVEWRSEKDEERRRQGFRICLSHPKPVKQVFWHGKGDYFSSAMPEGGALSVQIHQLSKWRTQNPFGKSKGLIQKVAFHPSKPIFFVATQRYVWMYDLSKLELIKKLLTGVKWVSSIDIHPQGDNLIIGSYDKKLCWFDLELSTKPYKVLRHHTQAVRQVCFHKKYPLFASCSDDGSTIICHGMVYNDLLQNALIVPVKVLKGHGKVNNLGVLDCQFHPTQPWIFTAGADSTIRLCV